MYSKKRIKISAYNSGLVEKIKQKKTQKRIAVYLLFFMFFQIFSPLGSLLGINKASASVSLTGEAYVGRAVINWPSSGDIKLLRATETPVSAGSTEVYSGSSTSHTDTTVADGTLYYYALFNSDLTQKLSTADLSVKTGNPPAMYSGVSLTSSDAFVTASNVHTGNVSTINVEAYNNIKVLYKTAPDSSTCSISSMTDGAATALTVNKGTYSITTSARLNTLAYYSFAFATVQVDGETTRYGAIKCVNIMPVDTTDPTISGRTNNHPTVSSIHFTFNTSEPAKTRICYGIDTTYDCTGVEWSTEYLTSHEYTLQNDGFPDSNVNFAILALDNKDNLGIQNFTISFPTNTVGAPNFSVTHGSQVFAGTVLTISSATSGSTIKYTTDNTSPAGDCSNGITYTSPILLDTAGGKIFRAVVCKAGMTSNSSSSMFTVVDAYVEFTPGPGTVNAGTEVTMFAPVGTLHYTTDGSDPTASSPSGTTVTIDVTKTIKAIVVYNDVTSPIQTAAYTIYAPGAPTTYTVTFNSNGGSSVSSITGVSSGATISAPTVPTKTGHTFAGWYKESGLTNAWNFSNDTVTANTTLYAKWTVDSATEYTVTFNSNGGSSVSSITGVNSGDTITAPTAPTKTGYTFGGWYKESGLTNAWNFSSDTVTANTTLYAKWSSADTNDFTSSDKTQAENGATVIFGDNTKLPSNLSEGLNLTVANGSTTGNAPTGQAIVKPYEITLDPVPTGNFLATITLNYPSGVNWKEGDTVLYWNGSTWTSEGVTVTGHTTNTITFTTNHFSEFAIATNTSGNNTSGGLLPVTGASLLNLLLNLALAFACYFTLVAYIKKTRYSKVLS